MDINFLRGISTIFVMVAFLWITWWAFSKKQKSSFDDAANLPFADEPENKHSPSLNGNGDKKS